LEKPDLILLDVQFPVDAANVGGALQDGFFIMQWLRRMGEAKDIPVIIISGNHSASCRDRALAAGAVEFFPKPIDNTTLLDIVEKTLSRNPHGGPAAHPGQRVLHGSPRCCTRARLLPHFLPPVYRYTLRSLSGYRSRVTLPSNHHTIATLLPHL
jgi:DNA-binding response OmpR family regulator